MLDQEQFGRAQPRRRQLLQPRGGGSVPRGKLRDERDAGVLDAASHPQGCVARKVARDRAVHRLAVLTGGVDRQRAVALGREEKYCIDIVTCYEHAVAVTRFGGKDRGGLRSPVGHGIADCPYLKALLQSPQDGGA